MNVGNTQEKIERKRDGYGEKNEKSFYLTTGGSVFLHVSFILLMIFDTSFREIVESFLGVRQPVLPEEKIYVAILDPSQIHLGKETRSSLLQKGYSINGQPTEQGHQNVLSEPTLSPPTNHRTVPPRTEQIMKNTTTPPLSRAIILKQDQGTPNPERVPRRAIEARNRTPVIPNGAPSTGSNPNNRVKTLFRKSQKSNDNRIPRRKFVQKRRTRHLPNDEFPNQADNPHRSNPSSRRLPDRFARIARPPIVPEKQIQTRKRAPSIVPNSGIVARQQKLVVNTSREPQKESVPMTHNAKLVRPPTATSRTSITPDKRKSVPRIRTTTRMNRPLDQASLGSMQASIPLQSSVNPVYATRSEASEGTTVNEADMVYSNYIKNIDKKFEEVGRFPHYAAKKNVTGETRISFTILKDGTLSDLRIIQSSDHASLDEESLRIVQDSAPFQPIPDLLKKVALTLTWTFHYSGGKTVPINR